MAGNPNEERTNFQRTRTGLRYPPEPNCIVLIDLERGPEFNVSHIGMITDESPTGCGIVLLKSDQLYVGALCMVQLGNLPPIEAEVRWTKLLDPKVVMIGCQYRL